MPTDAARMISRAANAPVYGLFETLLGDNGVVGGTILNHRVEGERAVRLALEILQGKLPAEPLTIPPAPLVPMFDWQQLKRWGLNETALPAGAIVLNKPVSVWERYRWAIIGIIVFCPGGNRFDHFPRCTETPEENGRGVLEERRSQVPEHFR